MIFKTVRKAALEKWLHQTKRIRKDTTDDYSQSYECDWQTWYRTKPETDKSHYSVFCSIGDWNTSITDYLSDERFDHCDMGKDGDKDILYRHFMMLFLITSEILTDFQDLLSVFNGQMRTNAILRNERTASRNLLSSLAAPNFIQNLFDYINKVGKHKVNNLHVCNHHLHIHFDDEGNCPSQKAITVSTINIYFPNLPNGPIPEPDTVSIPTLDSVIDTIINGYKIIDQQFRNNDPKYKTLCGLYVGISVQD